MKTLIILLCCYCFAISNKWTTNPMNIKDGTIDFINNDISCQELGTWLANASKTNTIIKNSKQRVAVNWQKISVIKAWQQFRIQCLNQPKPSNKTTFLIKLRWLILDDSAETALGINNNDWQLTRTKLAPSFKLWHTIMELRDFNKVLDFILQDLTKNKHIINLSQPTLLMTSIKESQFKTSIILPYTVKTLRSTYETLHTIPIDLKVSFNSTDKYSANLNISSHMQHAWQQTDKDWPLAIHEINTNVNLRYSEETIIAKQIIYTKKETNNNHKWLAFLRDDKYKNYNLVKLYVTASINPIRYIK